jgi:hypothetical protein
VPLWVFPHLDLGEPALPDGSLIRRPVVTVAARESEIPLRAVVDSGSPISVADSTLFSRLGINLGEDPPLFEVPLTLGGGSQRLPVYSVELLLQPPPGSQDEPISWTLQLGARENWKLPFAVLFGQRGWFDRFRTTIDGNATSVQR